MMKTVTIDRPERLDEDMEDFRLDNVDLKRNYTSSRIRLTRNPETDEPYLFYSQELTRNFKNPNDPFGRRQLIKVYTPSNLEAAADTVLEQKFNDTILAHKNKIPDYSPLSDIHSDEMALFLDEDTATFLDDIGIQVEGLGEDFQSIESVEANPYLEDIAEDAMQLKGRLTGLRSKYDQLKQRMMQAFDPPVFNDTLSEEAFEQRLAQESLPDGLIQSYLELKEQMDYLKSRIGAVSKVVFSETASKIQLPKSLERSTNEFLERI